jgi:hypothetical protein
MYEVSSIPGRFACMLLVLVACGTCTPARADEQSQRIQQLEQRLARSLQLIDKLSARVDELERAARPAAQAQSAASSPAATWGDPTKSIAALQESVNQIAEGLSKNANDTGIPVHGFVDVGAGWSSGADPTRLRGFHAGSLDLYLTPQIGTRVKSLIELVVEFDQGGGSIDMERVQIGYTFSDALTLWGGRFHSPFGLWNTSFHHGANLQTSISRPKFIDFEDGGGLIPAHSVGVWADGKVGLGPGRLIYDAYVANGPSIREQRLDPNTFTDDNADKMVGFNLGYAPHGALSGLTAGLHGFRTHVGEYNLGDVLRGTTRLRMLGAYLSYDTQEWEVFGEYYRFRNTDASGGPGLVSNAGFLHVGRTFGALTPFARYERASLDPRDNYFRSLRTGRSFTHVVLGARYALDANSSLKLELRRSREAAVSQYDENGSLVDVESAAYRRALFQYSIAF